MDKYETGALVGKGSFGSVVLATRRSDGAQFVIKRLPIHNITDREMDAYHNEIKLLSELEHPGIVTYMESFVDRAQMDLCIVMRHCNGGDLAQFIKARQAANKGAGAKLSESDIKSHFVQMALALHYMHEKNILHRDLKAGNVFMRDGMVQLGDFGISKVLNGTADLASTCIGTPYYMSPELFKNKPYNHKSDVWALGCILYELTSLRHAFDAQNINGLASKVIGGVYTPIGATYSRDLRDLIKAMLGATPSSRPSVKQILLQPPLFKYVRKYIRAVVLGAGSGSGGSASASAASDADASCGSEGDFRPAHVLNLRNQLDRLGPPLSSIFPEVERERIEKRASGRQNCNVHVGAHTPTAAAAAAAAAIPHPRSRLTVNAPVAAAAAASAASNAGDLYDNDGDASGGGVEDAIDRTLVAAPRGSKPPLGEGDHSYPGTIRRRRGRRAQSQSEMPVAGSGAGSGIAETAAATAAASSSVSSAVVAAAAAAAAPARASPRVMGRRCRRESDDLQERLAALDREHALRLEELRAEEEARGKLQRDFERLQAAQAQRAGRIQARKAQLLGEDGPVAGGSRPPAGGSGGGGDASLASTVTSSSNASANSSASGASNLPVIPGPPSGAASPMSPYPLAGPAHFSASLSNLPALAHAPGAVGGAGAGVGPATGGSMSSRESSRHASPALGPATRPSRAQHAAQQQQQQQQQGRMPNMLLGNGVLLPPSLSGARSASPAPPGLLVHVSNGGGGSSSAGPSSAAPSPRFNSRRLVAASSSAASAAAAAPAAASDESKEPLAAIPVVTVSSPRPGAPDPAAGAPPGWSAEEQHRHLNLKLLKRKAAMRASPSFGAASNAHASAALDHSPSSLAAGSAPTGPPPPPLEMGVAPLSAAAAPAPPPRGPRVHGRRDAHRITVPSSSSHPAGSSSVVGAAAAAGVSPPSSSPLSPDSAVLSPSGVVLDAGDEGEGASERAELDRLRLERVRLEELLTRMDKLDEALFDGAAGGTGAVPDGHGDAGSQGSAVPPHVTAQRRPSLPLHHVHSPPAHSSNHSHAHFASSTLPSAFDAPLLYKGRATMHSSHQAQIQNQIQGQGQGQGQGHGQQHASSAAVAGAKVSRRHTAHNPGSSMDAAVGVGMGAGGGGAAAAAGAAAGAQHASTPTASAGGLILAPRHRPYAMHGQAHGQAHGHPYSASPPPPSSNGAHGHNQGYGHGSSASASSHGQSGQGPGHGLGTRDRILALKAAKKSDEASAEQERLLAARKAYFHDRVRADQRTKEFYGNAPVPPVSLQPSQQHAHYPYPPASSRSPSRSPELPEHGHAHGHAGHRHQSEPASSGSPVHAASSSSSGPAPSLAQSQAQRRLLALEEEELVSSSLEVEQFQQHLAQYTRRIETLRTHIEQVAGARTASASASRPDRTQLQQQQQRSRRRRGSSDDSASDPDSDSSGSHFAAASDSDAGDADDA